MFRLVQTKSVFLAATFLAAALVFALPSAGFTAPKGQDDKTAARDARQGTREDRKLGAVNDNKSGPNRQDARSGRSGGAFESRPGNTPNATPNGNTPWMRRDNNTNTTRSGGFETRRDNTTGTRPPGSFESRPGPPVFSRKDTVVEKAPSNNTPWIRNDNKTSTRPTGTFESRPGPPVFERKDTVVDKAPNNNTPWMGKDNTTSTRPTGSFETRGDNTAKERRDGVVEKTRKGDSNWGRGDNKTDTRPKGDGGSDRNEGNKDYRPKGDNNWGRGDNKADTRDNTFERRRPAPGTGSWSLSRENRTDWNFRKEDFHRPRCDGGFFHYNAPRYSRPFHYGYWVVDHRDRHRCNSPFFFFGLLYIFSPRVVVISVPSYTYVTVSSYDYDDVYYLSSGRYGGLHSALNDIRNGWVDGRSDLIDRHMDPDARVSIYLDGRYSYSLNGADYRDMTLDAMQQIRTIEFNVYKVARRSDGASTFFARHEFYDADSVYKRVYVSYTMERYDGTWWIVAAGCSSRRLE